MRPDTGIPAGKEGGHVSPIPNRLIIRLLRLTVPVLAAVLIAACACTVGSRTVRVGADLLVGEDEGAFGTFTFVVNEFRGSNGGGSNSIGWGYTVPVPRDSVAAVEIREGPGPFGGRLLISLTTWGDPPWVPSGLAPMKYPGPLSFDEFYDVLRRGEIHVEFTLHGKPGPTVWGMLGVEVDRPWQDGPCT